MSETATITVTEPKKKDNGWYEIKDDGDRVFSTKKSEIGEAAIGLAGQKAVVEFTVKTNEKDGRTYTNRYLDSITAAQSDGRESISARRDDGESADWDLIGLRKTRCHLWGAFMAGDAMQSLIAMQLRDKSDIKQSELVHNLLAAGRDLVRGAEIDIYHRDPAAAQEDVPF